MMHIVELQAENVKRLSAVRIRPNGAPIVVVAGDNEAGKSSVLDSIQMALGGPKAAPGKPVRQGQDRAVIVLDLGDMVVTRVFSAQGGASLKVTNRDGMTYPSPQAMLDGLLGKLTFDPLVFATMDPGPQAATLRALAGIDTTELDDERKRCYDERTLVNRELKQAEAMAKDAPHHEGVGVELADRAAVLSALDAADEAARLAAVADMDATRWKERSAALRQNVLGIEARIEQLREDIATAEQTLISAEEQYAQADAEMYVAMKKAANLLVAVPDRGAIRSQLDEIERVNAKARDNIRRGELLSAAQKKEAASTALTERINAIDTEKAEALARARFPIEGLGLDGSGVTWNGLPFAQASTAVRVRVSVAVGLALNPTLKVLLVRNGNDLGEKNLALIAEMAASAGAQVWVERIAGSDGHATVVIEDGSVAEVIAS